MKLFPASFEPWQPQDSAREIAVLMSGGVDSSVTALMLRDQGWRVLGITMKIPTLSSCSSPSSCCGGDAALVCHELKIPHYFIEVEDRFQQHVVEPFRAAYIHGRTPNPCIDCNTFLKFTGVWDLLEATFGIRYLATGHYAKVLRNSDGNEAALYQGADRQRDQSYFIYGVPRQRLPFFLLPMGSLRKQEVREIAQRHELFVAAKPDSMELCFAGEGDYRDALNKDNSDGPILNTDGRELARHNGIWNYTVGQRRGLGIAAAEPLYVLQINPTQNAVVVGTREQAFANTVTAKKLHILAPEQLRAGEHFLGKIRSYSPASPCLLTALSDGQLTVDFKKAQFAPTHGQHLVLYSEEGQVLGGGTIAEPEPHGAAGQDNNAV